MNEPDATAGRPAAGPPIGAVLAGGRGSRIGGAKALVELAGRPLISYPLTAVVEAGLEPLVVAKPDSKLPQLSCRLVREPAQPRHPLCGILAALRYAGRRPLVAIGCDMPFASADLLAWLGSTPERLVLPAAGGGPQPFPGRYDGSLVPALEAVPAGQQALRPVLASLRPRLISAAELARFGDPGRLCFNVNTAADLVRAEELLAAPTQR
jgi:molybdenum cofactor guanylyltransferase